MRFSTFRNLCVAAVLMVCSVSAAGEPGSSLEQELQALLAGNAPHSADPAILLRLASVYLDLGDDVYSRRDERLGAYQAGARAAKRALEIDEANGEAHYLYAANLGSATELIGMVASALTIADIKAHVRRARELRPDHGPTLHMMGMMLEELPWMLGGDRAEALRCLQDAVTQAPDDDHARLDLAKAYLRRNETEAASRELQRIAVTPGAKPARRDEARALLDALQGKSGKS